MGDRHNGFNELHKFVVALVASNLTFYLHPCHTILTSKQFLRFGSPAIVTWCNYHVILIARCENLKGKKVKELKN